MSKLSDYYDNSLFKKEYYKTDKCFTVAEIVNPVFDKNGKLDMQWIDKAHTGKYGIANKNGLVNPCEYDDCRHYEDYYYGTHIFNEYCALKKGDKWAYFDNSGKQVTEFIYNSSFDLDSQYANTIEENVFLSTENYIAIKTDAGAGFIDTSGKEVIPAGTFAETRPVHNGKAWVKDKSTGLWGVIDLSNEEEKKLFSSDEKTTVSELEWRQSYRNILLEALSDSSNNRARFDIADLNADSVPELLISKGQAHKDGVDIYTMQNGIAYFAGELGCYGTIRYNATRNCILVGNMSMGYETFAVYSITDGELVIITNGYSDQAAKESPPYTFEIDNNDVSEDEYKSVCHEYGFYGDAQVVYYGTAYKLASNTIDEQFPSE